MGRFLVMRVVGFVRDRLGRGEAAHDKNAEHQQDCQRSTCADVAHHLSINPD